MRAHHREGEVESRYFTVITTARYLGVTERAVRHYVQRRAIPFTRIGSRVLFDRQALDRWLGRRAVRVDESGRG